MTDVNPVRSDNCRQYNNVPPQIDLPAMDHEIIDLWARQHTFDKSLEATKDGQPGDITGMVEFRASYRAGKRHNVLHEVSRFQRRAGRWMYVDGDVD